MKKSRIAGVVAGALVAISASFTSAQAQDKVETGEVTILNDHLHVHQVFVFDATGRRHSLGLIGHEELKTFEIPAKVKAMGAYRVGLQQWTPLPGIGVSVQAPPMKMTGMLRLAPGEVAAIVVDNESATVEFFPAVNTQQQFQF